MTIRWLGYQSERVELELEPGTVTLVLVALRPTQVTAPRMEMRLLPLAPVPPPRSPMFEGMGNQLSRIPLEVAALLELAEGSEEPRR